MLHLVINACFSYFVIVSLDKIPIDIILITIYLIKEINREIKEMAKLKAGNTYESLAFASWRDLQ